MQLDTTTTAALLAVAIVLAVVAAVLAGLALAGQRRVRAAYRAFGTAGRPGEDILSLLRCHLDEVRGLRDDVRGLRRYGEGLRDLLGGCLSRVHTVRYDAFDDMGGRMSFSTALLDEHGDGVVLTSINGRTETRTYAKPVQAGTSRHNLSDEERHVIERALAGTGKGGEEELLGSARGRAVPARAAARVVRDAS